MDYGEFKRHLGKAGMTVNVFASYVDVEPTSVSNYSKRGEVPRSYALIAVLLGETVDGGTDAASVLKKYGIVPRIGLRSRKSKSQQLKLLPNRRDAVNL